MEHVVLSLLNCIPDGPPGLLACGDSACLDDAELPLAGLATDRAPIETRGCFRRAPRESPAGRFFRGDRTEAEQLLPV